MQLTAVDKTLPAARGPRRKGRPRTGDGFIAYMEFYSFQLGLWAFLKDVENTEWLLQSSGIF